MYDMSRSSTFENVERWLKELRDHAEPNIVIMLVGNKADLAHKRQVETEDALAYATKNKLAFIETSAQDGSGVEDGFRRIVAEINKLRVAKQMGKEGLSAGAVPKGSTINMGTSKPVDEKRGVVERSHFLPLALYFFLQM